MSESRELFVELGCEELPASYVTSALAELGPRLSQALAAARIDHTAPRVYGTPRRLAVVAKVATRQRDVAETLTGPPVSAAFDKDGRPTKAAEAFARKLGIDVGALEQVQTEKGLYLAGRRSESGRAARDVLPDVVRELLRGFKFKKSMRWSTIEQTFARPVRWIAALFDGEVLPVECFGCRAGRRSVGHRFLAPQEFDVAGSADWLAELRGRFVIPDVEERRQLVEAELARVEREAGARRVPDDALIEEVTQLVEYPTAVLGSFPASFLDLPREVIVNSMRAHQRFFAFETADGRLHPAFATIAGTVVRDAAVVRAGNERVLRARLEDARFCHDEDRKHTLDERARKLEGVVFQTKLGTVAEKVARIRAVAAKLAERLGADARRVDHAAQLCKADLVTLMVGEFPDLQGVMGRDYALREGAPADVADAIAEHYQPRGASDALPRGDLGAIVGLADRIDTLVGCFAVGLEPTGSADPFALRRAALAIVAVLLGRGWSVPLTWLAETAATAGYGKPTFAAAVPRVVEFVRTRLRGVLAETYPADVVEAVLAVQGEDLPDARARALALAHLRKREDFEPLGIAFKRVANILKSSAAEGTAFDPALAADPAERALHDRWRDVSARVRPLVERKDYGAALAALADLRVPVDRLFDAVLVMDPDPMVRANRLALLALVGAAFSGIADFKLLQVAEPQKR